MPKVKKSSNLKQRNKPFKGKSKAKQEDKQSGLGVRKKIQKSEKTLNKQDRKNRILQKRKERDTKSGDYMKVQISENIDSMLQAALIQLYKSQPNPPKIVLLASFNEAADTELIRQNFTQLLKGEEEVMSENIQTSKASHEFNFKVVTTSNKISPELKSEGYVFISCARRKDVVLSSFKSKLINSFLQNKFLDYCKVADIVCLVLSCKDVEQETLVLDPYAHAKAFDDFGYEMLECMRAQGLPNVVGVLQDLDKLHQNKQNTVKKIYQRFFESEIGVDEKFLSLENDPKSQFAFLRTLQTIPLKQLSWREIRSYMMASKLEVDTSRGVLEVAGFLRGTCLNPNQLVHVTGFGDFQVGKIDILHNPCMSKHQRSAITEGQNQSEIIASMEAQIDKVESLAQFSNNKNLTKIVEKDGAMEESKENGGIMDVEDTNRMNGSKKKVDEMTLEEKLWDEMEGLAIEDEAIRDQDSDVSYDEKNDRSMANLEEEKNKLKFKLMERTEDEMEFVDEVDYPVHISLKDRFHKYTGLKSFRNSEWNAYSGLPAEFEKITIFDDFNKTQKNAVSQANQNAFAAAGFYVKLYIINFPITQLQSFDKDKPFIVSSLLKHERKVSLQHMQIRRHLDVEVRSKEPVEIHAGFRIFNTCPTFSKFFTNCQKVKMERKTATDKVYLASIYSQVQYLPANILMFKTEVFIALKVDGTKRLIASGDLLKCDPLKVILKRAILTGYPLKIHKRKAVIRMMFFNNTDVNYFMPVELATKHRLKGHIKESLGTHGLYKCVFNNNVKANDTVCMYLYKRVFPKWPYEQVDSSFNTVNMNMAMA